MTFFFLLRRKNDEIFYRRCTLYRTLLGWVQAYLLKPKTLSLEPIHRPRNRLSALNIADGWFQLKVAYDFSVIRSPGTFIRDHTPVRQNRLDAPARGGIKRILSRTTRTAKSARDAEPQMQVPMRFLLAQPHTFPRLSS